MSKQITRRALVEGMVPKIVGDERFQRTIIGCTLDQLSQIVNLVLDARNKTFKELSGNQEE